MKLILALTFALLSASATRGITIDIVPVGEVGNPSDPNDGDVFTSGIQHLGAVAYPYNIGKYEVTVGQYTAFLNAVAATDTYGLYTPFMATDVAVAGIAQSCSPNCTYSVVGSPNHPIAYVDWGDAARFANWLHNGQPIGTQNALTTEDGAYTLNGATSDATLGVIARNPNATWFLPSVNEWYKAAYYQPVARGGDADSYWVFPMRTNSIPFSDEPPGATPDNTHVGNFFFDDFQANDYNDGRAVCTTTTQSCLTDVGAYNLSPAFYGTFDQGGNLKEWTDSVFSDSNRDARGGGWNGESSFLRSNNAQYAPASRELKDRGFRVASVGNIPEPSSNALMASIFALLATHRRSRNTFAA